MLVIWDLYRHYKNRAVSTQEQDKNVKDCRLHKAGSDGIGAALESENGHSQAGAG